MKATAQAEAEMVSSPLDDLLEETMAEFGAGVPMHVWEHALLEPLREFLRRPGKQFRARLVETAWMLAGGRPGCIPPELPLVVELLHAGSLIVDDIEDGSPTRRGAAALHEIYGTPTALNTGNWLYFWPLVLIDRIAMPEDRRAAIHMHLRHTLLRCHQGQALDLAVAVTAMRQKDVPRVVKATSHLKAGSLMELAATMGAIAAGAGHRLVEAIGTFGGELGIGLQMLDDLGGLTHPDRRQKGIEDLRLLRPTWPWAWAANRLNTRAFANLQMRAGTADNNTARGEIAAMLAEISADFGKSSVRVHLRLALAMLHDVVGSVPSLEQLEHEILRLEDSYV